jgi:phage terminase large subunit-like protein
MVLSTLRTVRSTLPVTMVTASRGKQLRAEPIAGLYEQGKVHHVGILPKLEDEMCQWDPDTCDWSPNRLDALVWALSDLMLKPDIDYTAGAF